MTTRPVLALISGGGVSMTATRAEIAQLRREGMADAAVLLLAKRVNPTSSLDDWARLLDLDHDDMVAAVDRLKARAAANRPKPKLRAVTGGRRTRTSSAGQPRHRKYTPAADGTWPCPDDSCDITLDDGRALATHVRVHHTPPVTCDICGKECNAAGIGPHRRKHALAAGEVAS